MANKNKPANPMITEEVFQQYETLRTRHAVNMLDLHKVYTYALHEGYKQLAEVVSSALSLKDRAYYELLTRHKFYKNKYK